MLTDKELIDAFLTGQTIFYGESIFKDSEGLGRFSSGKIIKIQFLEERVDSGLTCVTFAAGGGVIHHVHTYDFKNLFDLESLRDKLNFSLASNNPL